MAQIKLVWESAPLIDFNPRALVINVDQDVTHAAAQLPVIVFDVLLITLWIQPAVIVVIQVVLLSTIKILFYWSAWLVTHHATSVVEA